MAKKDFIIKKITKKDAYPLLSKYHYLKDKFKTRYNYGLYKDNTLLGVIIYTGFPVKELSVGCFGINSQEGLFELSRLCIHPDIQKTEHNLASWFISKTIKLLRKETNVKCILSYADSKYHTGVVYRASNFKYYGLTDPKKDFYFLQEDGTYKKHSRGKVKGMKGKWKQRSRKHRYLMIFDNTLQCKWKEC